MHIFALIPKSDIEQLEKLREVGDVAHEWEWSLPEKIKTDEYYRCGLDHGAIYLSDAMEIWRFFDIRPLA